MILAYNGPNPGGVYTDPIGHWVVVVVAMLVTFVILITVTAYVVLLERVLIGRFQRRPGPNRVGPVGLLQSAVDGVKLLIKESFMPTGVDRFIYLLAPAIAVARPRLLTWAVMPFALWDNRSVLDRQRQHRHPAHLRDQLAERVRDRARRLRPRTTSTRCSVACAARPS